jgi:hypothetical protein
MNDVKTACPKCGKKEKSTLHHAGLDTTKKDGTIDVKCILCGWEGCVLIRAEVGILKQESIACTKGHPWDKKTLPVIHMDADYINDETETLSCPNCRHIWSLGPDI